MYSPRHQAGVYILTLNLSLLVLSYFAAPNCTIPGDAVLESFLPTAEEDFVMNLWILAAMVVCYWILVILVFAASRRRVLHWWRIPSRDIDDVYRHVTLMTHTVTWHWWRIPSRNNDDVYPSRDIDDVYPSRDTDDVYRHVTLMTYTVTWHWWRIPSRDIDDVYRHVTLMTYTVKWHWWRIASRWHWWRLHSRDIDSRCNRFKINVPWLDCRHSNAITWVITVTEQTYMVFLWSLWAINLQGDIFTGDSQS